MEALNNLAQALKFTSGPAGVAARKQTLEVMRTVGGGVKLIARCGRGLGHTEHVTYIAREDLPKAAAALLTIYNAGQTRNGLQLVGKSLKRKVG